MHEARRTKDTEHVLSLPDSVDDILVAALDGSLLPVVYLLRTPMHHIGDVFHTLNRFERETLKQEAAEPRGPKLYHNGHEYSCPLSCHKCRPG